ncbi:MAG: hypothetical protein GWN71_32040, partial [Gammaproteobacteria bacterium]|nr:hypothetical protein [Gemmatimonadota bacterium]NIU78018.1 hypothetical protein [Gammaproteobacteria bacterium]NIY11462.1 hypothetical protein [Gemmatimonadota bacterium]
AAEPATPAESIRLGQCVAIGIVESPNGDLFEQLLCSSGAIILVPTTCANPLLDGDPRHCKES